MIGGTSLRVSQLLALCLFVSATAYMGYRLWKCKQEQDKEQEAEVKEG